VFLFESSTPAAVQIITMYENKYQGIHAISTAQDTISQAAIGQNALYMLAPTQNVTLPLSRGSGGVVGRGVG
jgi:hypothetical protein